MLIMFFSICILFVVFVIYVLTRKTEAQQWVIVRFAGLFFLMAFMMISESYRVSQGEKIEAQERVIEELQAQVKYVETLRIQIKQLDKHRHNLWGRVKWER